MRSPRLAIGLAAALLLCLTPSEALAQWYIGAYLGANHSHDATVSIRQPSHGLALDFHDVRFDSEWNYPRRYYGVRIGRLGGPSRRFGYEFEMIHLKAAGDVTRDYEVTAVDGTTLPSGAATPMNTVVQEYRMTHGVNLGVFNVVMRRPLGSERLALMMRGGAGVTVPHAETSVNGGVIHHYEYGGPGVHASAGLQIRVHSVLAAVAEYKWTWARPTIDIVDGEAWTTLTSHHVALGFSLSLTR